MGEALFYPEFAAMLTDRVHTREPTMEMRLAPCTCNAVRTKSLRYGQPTLQQSTLLIAPRSLAGLGPNYQAQVDAPNSEPFPMLKYVRQHAIDQMYHISVYKHRFHFSYYFQAYHYSHQDSMKISGPPKWKSKQGCLEGT